MRVFIYLASAVIVLCAASIWSVRPIAMPVILYGDATETIVHSEKQLSQKALNIYIGKFSKAKYYSAFATGTGDRLGWSGERNSPQDARVAALAFCNQGGDGCEIYAELRPEGYNPAIHGVTISQPGAKVFHEFGTRDGTFEYALSETGALAIRTSLDWTLLPALSVKARCDAFAKNRALPMHVPHGPCQAYVGRIYMVH